MLKSGPVKQLAGAIMGIALCASSTTATAAMSAPRASISPIVALSAFAAPGSGSVLCATAAQGASTISAAAQVQPAPGTGCVLPVVDQPVPVVQPSAPVAYAPVASEGIGLLPVLAGLALIAGLAAWFLLDKDNDGDGDIDLPGVNPPLSPD